MSSGVARGAASVIALALPACWSSGPLTPDPEAPTASDAGGGLPGDAACGPACAADAGPTEPPPEGDGGLAAAPGDAGPPSDRPDGVALCYTAASSDHPATLRFWHALRAGDVATRAQVIADLEAALAQAPDQEEFALLLGLASLWRVAEPSLDDVFALLDSIGRADSALEQAYELCPTDHRIAAWLGPIKIRAGRMLGDQALVAAGFDVLQQGLDHYPGFVLFSKFLVHADLPASDPEFVKAVEAVRENTAYCGTPITQLSSDPACHNHYRAAHNIEGAAVFLGDMYAKGQDRAAALAAYEMAKAMPNWESWVYRELLEERIATLDARIAAAATEHSLDDLEPAWASAIQCSLCHRE